MCNAAAARRTPVRTALLVVVVAALPADLIVYSGAAQGSLDASRLPPRIALRVTGTAGGVRYDGLITAWTTFSTWARAVRTAG